MGSVPLDYQVLYTLSISSSCTSVKNKSAYHGIDILINPYYDRSDACLCVCVGGIVKTSPFTIVGVQIRICLLFGITEAAAANTRVKPDIT